MIDLNKTDIDFLSERLYEIKTPQLSNFEIYEESKNIKTFDDNETFTVLDFDNQLSSLLAFKVWKDKGVALIGYEEGHQIQGKDKINYVYIHSIVIQMTLKDYQAFIKKEGGSKV